jgi:hypothetical protein
MKSSAERCLFQLVVAVAALVPIAAGAVGALRGTLMIAHLSGSCPDLESHFGYLSGLLLGIGLGFQFAAVDLEKGAPLFRALALIVIVGGAARLLAALRVGFPDTPHELALAMELVVVPLLLVWHRRVTRRPAGKMAHVA